MNEQHIRAYSIPLNTNLKILKFDMVYYNGQRYNTYHSDSDTLSAKMQKIIFEDYRFASKNRQLFFSDITASLPDGRKKMLSPFAIFVFRDSTERDEVVFKFWVAKMVKDRKM
jgi:hypothetical protein